jgi:triosephosphate isomerase (TIM)
MNMKPIIIGNWKMHITTHEARGYIENLLKRDLNLLQRAEVIICPAAPVIPVVAEMCRNSGFKWGGQNAHWEDSGAFTGEVSMSMLVDEGCSMVLCGHSERRRYFHETDSEVSRKVQQARAHGMTPVLCVGESFEQRQQNIHQVTVSEQVRKGVDLLSGFPEFKPIVAYEPIWSVGTGHPIEPAQAKEMASVIRETLQEDFSDQAESISILYGGSVTPENVASFVDGELLNGVLIGGASLDPETFYQIIQRLT